MFSKTFEEHVDHLQAVFGRLCQHNLKLKPSKCERFKTKVSYLGHVLGISTDPEKASAVNQWPDEQQKVVDTVKEKLTHPPITAYADYSLPFGVHTYFSSSGLGAVLD